MARLELAGVAKTFADGTEAVRGLDLAVADGELVVLVGPSGCGKSTALRLIAGLETPDAGSVRMDGAAVDRLGPQARNAAMVFQNYALYPHMTVAANLEFPLRMRGAGRAERRRRVAETAAMLGLDDLLGRRPAELSGGQRQRAAMGRALVREPAVFLMDEPLSNLDAKLRVRIRNEIADLQRRLGATTLYVTHDQAEAMTLGQRVGVMRGGRLLQTDTPEGLYEHPAEVFVAGFLGSPGMNVLRTRLQRQNGEWWLDFGGERLAVPAAAVPAGLEGGEVLAGLRPEAFRPAAETPEAAHVRLRVGVREYLGHETLVYLEPPVATVDPERPERAGEEAPALVARLPGDAAVPERGELVLGVDTRGLRLFGGDGRALG
ncbi:MAG TPA: ABC transporter ATP-binding protein [Gammaproteobacteria bacterium]|nr:ABC transporter ATP-binding protein [Gammaproteobacteria bacterium]